MKATTAHPHPITIAQVLTAFGQCLILCALYALQHMAAAFAAAERQTLRACDWLDSHHNFADKDDPVVMSGWQYVGIGALALAGVLLLTIKW